MTLTNAGEQCKPAPVQKKSRDVPPAAFFDAMAAPPGSGVQGVVFAGKNGAPNDHLWNTQGASYGEWAARHTQERTPAYFTLAAFNPADVTRYHGRKAENVVSLPGFWFDVDVGDGHAKPGYPDEKAARAATAQFFKATSVVPSFLVLTGSGGLHGYYCLNAPLAPNEWRPRAAALVALAAMHGLNIDAQVTTDAARIMRAPGSAHQKTGRVVTAHALRKASFTIVEFDAMVGYAPGSVLPILRTDRRATGINDDVLESPTPYSYLRAMEQCGAMAQAAQRNGGATSYPVWTLALVTAARSEEGRDLAHQISSGHSDYSEADTDRKLDSLTGGPAGCDAWANAYGTGGPCDTCGHRGSLKNPAVQLGRTVDTTPPGEAPAPEAVSAGLAENEGGSTCPAHISEMNLRYALVRSGSKIVVMDRRTPSMTAAGAVHGVGFLELNALRTTFRGRYAPLQKVGEKPRPLAEAWMEHPQRRQYAGMVFAPEGGAPPNLLNLWQGFAVTPAAGDVGPWLEVLANLVPDPISRAYVLRWLAWKVQTPGGVPDTVLIFTGAKGTGKNSLFDPLLVAFGRHAMLADDPELVAGRFTWHLMDKCLAVLDEAVFVGDPRQSDRIKSRVTAKSMMYEQKGMDPVTGINRCAYVMLTNHAHAWQATTDERRAVVIEVGEGLRGNLTFWGQYHAWVKGDGPAVLLHHLQGLDLTGFNPRAIPKGEALRKQVEQTALRTPAVAWWHQCLTEGAIHYRDSGVDRSVQLNENAETQIVRQVLRLSYEQSASARGRFSNDWSAVAKRVKEWAGPGGLRKVYTRAGTVREWREILPPLVELRENFTASTQVGFHD